MELVRKTLDRVRELSQTEPKTLLQLGLKLAEEAGETAGAINGVDGAPGMSYKNLQVEDVGEEACDAILVALSICYKIGMTEEDILSTMLVKCNKWEEKRES